MRNGSADSTGKPKNGAQGDAPYPLAAHSRHGHGSNAPALPAIGVAAELAGRDPGFQIGGYGLCYARKDTFFWRLRRAEEFGERFLPHV